MKIKATHLKRSTRIVNWEYVINNIGLYKVKHSRELEENRGIINSGNGIFYIGPGMLQGVDKHLQHYEHVDFILCDDDYQVTFSND